MSKTLQVIDPFFNLEIGNILELSEDGKHYVIECNEEFGQNNADGADISSSFSSKFTISTDYAKQLIKEGFLQEVVDDKQGFVNVFTEIDNLLYKYTTELSNIDKDMANMPMCVKIEKTTVLENLCKVLSHLKALKK